MTPQEKIMLKAGYVRASIISKTFGVAPSSILRRIERGAYKAERAGRLWFVQYADVLASKDTSRVQADALLAEITKLLTKIGE